MKRIVALMVVGLLMAAGSAQGADRISERSLSAMGLPGLRVMSDAEGQQIRGSGSKGSSGGALAVGASFAATQAAAPGTSSSAATLNVYIAAGDKFAVGVNGSGAASFAVPGASAAVAGGFSVGVAK